MRVLRAVAEHGSFTGAALALGYTQSAVSRQVAALERAAGCSLFDRRAHGAQLTPAGARLLRRASAALDELDRGERELHGTSERPERIRFGSFESGGATLLPEALVAMRERRPDVEVITREGSTPTLVRALRASSLDLVLIAARPPYPPPDGQEPPLRLDVLLEGELVVAVPARGELGLDGTVSEAELQSARWISSTQSAGDDGMGVWPTLPRRPPVVHQARGWLSKLRLVAAGEGVAMLPPGMSGIVPPGVRIVRVLGSRPVERRALLARRPGDGSTVLDDLVTCLQEVAEHLGP